MSEYQRYEFVAINHPLDAQAQAEVGALHGVPRPQVHRDRSGELLRLLL